jgi:hypothetical protein
VLEWDITAGSLDKTFFTISLSLSPFLSFGPSDKNVAEIHKVLKLFFTVLFVFN